MDTITLVAMGLTGLIGAAGSTYLSRRRARAVANGLMRIHVESLSALADSVIEVLCVDHGMEIEDAHARIKALMKERNNEVIVAELSPQKLTLAKAMIAIKRAERAAAQQK